MILLDGRAVAKRLLVDVRARIARGSCVPRLVVIMVGDNAASDTYVRLKSARAQEVGIVVDVLRFSAHNSHDAVYSAIKSANDDAAVHGIIVQLPLPPQWDADAVIATVDPIKDIDGFHPANVTRFCGGEKIALPPVFPQAICCLLEESAQPLNGKSAVLIVNSSLFGSVLAQALSAYGMTSSIVVRSDDILHHDAIARADVVVSACGVPRLLTGDLFKEGATVIDGGITRVDDRVVGDVDAESFKGRAIILSPVPGGVGPVTIACLLMNVVRAAEMQGSMR